MPRLLAAISIILMMAASVAVANAQTATTPTVSTVAVTSNPGTDNTYAASDKIEITVTFSEAVTVSTTDGTPRLSIDIGDQPRNIPYDRAGTGTGQLIFSYTVFAGDMDADGISVQANGIVLNDGTIRSTDDSTDANLAHSAQSFSTHKVDTEVVLVSNIGQADATDTITISATQSAEATFSVPLTDNGYDLTGIVLDVKTASTTLDVTVNAALVAKVDLTGVETSNDIRDELLAHNFTFSGSTASTGRQVFTLDDLYYQRANLVFSSNLFSFTRALVFKMTISGTGEGTVEIGATTASAQDTGGQRSFSIKDPASGEVVPRFRLVGHTPAIPFLYHTEVISSPAEGTSYKAGEIVEILAVTTRYTSVSHAPAEFELWFGDGAENRRVAQLLAFTPMGGISSYIYTYEVQSSDSDADGILLGDNPLGNNANFDFVDIGSNVPVALSLPSKQQETDQSVQGSQTKTCKGVLCAKLNVKQSLYDVDIEIFSENPLSAFGKHTEASLIQNPASYRPFSTFGSLSQYTFSYGGTRPAIIRLGDFSGITNTSPPDQVDLFFVAFDSELTEDAISRLILSVDDSMFPLQEGEYLDIFPATYLWRDTDVGWNDGDVVQVKLIEAPVTATFDAAAYAEDEGGTFDVTVTLGDTFENKTVTLPLEATGQGGATSADFSGVPSELVFMPGETEKTFTVLLTQDTLDDDDESITLSFGTLPNTVKSGGDNETATVTIRDDDDPEVDVEFGAATYSAAEGGSAAVEVTLSANPERTVTIPLTRTDQGGISAADYSGVPADVTFNTGETSKSFTFNALQDDLDDDDESVKLEFGTLPARVSEGAQDETTISIGDDDDPRVTVEFASDVYFIAEGSTSTVAVTLSADPERTVVVPLVKTDQGGVTAADYFGVPANVTFNSGEMVRTFSVSAPQDDLDDDGESVKLEFGPMPARVTPGTRDETTLSIDDDDDPIVSVSYEHEKYQVFEGGNVTLTVLLSADPERTVAITLSTTNQGGASDSDYSVPATVTFNAGEIRKTFRFTAEEDTDQEDTESVRLGFGTSLPSRVNLGTPSQTTVDIGDCEGGGIWCASLELGLRIESTHGRTWLNRAELDYEDFLYNGIDYRLGGIRVYPYEQSMPVTPPYAIPERASISIDLMNMSVAGFDRSRIPNDDHLDWTLHISTTSNGELLTAELPFSEAKNSDIPKWRWYGLDIDKLRLAWQEEQVYKLRIAEDFRPDRTAQPVGTPLYLRVDEQLSDSSRTQLRWVAPQTRNDYLPPVDTYRIQWKQSSGSWDTASDVSEATTIPSDRHGMTYRLEGLTAGAEYNIRVIAANETGNSQPSNVITYTRPSPSSQQQAANSPATGGPGIQGSPRTGETLTATTSGIADLDGMTGAAFAYQWIRHDPAAETDTDIEGATGRTYTVTSADEGRSLKVRVSFTDDGGNEESLTSYALIASPAPARTREPANSPPTGAPAISGTAQVGQTLTAATTGIGDKDGISAAVFAHRWLADDEAIKGATASTHTLTPGERGRTIRVRVTFTDNAGNSEELTSTATETVAAANSPATGAPAISGTAQVGETLTAATPGIADEDGLSNAAFVYQWLADGKDISGAASSAYTLAAADEGRTLRVRVSFTDDAGNREELTSAATAAVAPPPPPLTAAIHGAPDSHDGRKKFTFELRFSEELKQSFSFRTLRDHAFTVTGGEVVRAKRLGKDQNARWEIHVRPSGDGTITTLLPITTDCGAEGAICTQDGRMLSTRLEVSLSGPGG